MGESNRYLVHKSRSIGWTTGLFIPSNIFTRFVKYGDRFIAEGHGWKYIGIGSKAQFKQNRKLASLRNIKVSIKKLRRSLPRTTSHLNNLQAVDQSVNQIRFTRVI